MFWLYCCCFFFLWDPFICRNAHLCQELVVVSLICVSSCHMTPVKKYIYIYAIVTITALICGPSMQMAAFFIPLGMAATENWPWGRKTSLTSSNPPCVHASSTTASRRWVVFSFCKFYSHILLYLFYRMFLRTFLYVVADRRQHA